MQPNLIRESRDMKQCITCINFIECMSKDHINEDQVNGRHGDCRKVDYELHWDETTEEEITPKEHYRWELALDKAEKLNRCSEYAKLKRKGSRK